MSGQRKASDTISPADRVVAFRLKLVTAIYRTGNRAAVARSSGVSAVTLWRWKSRFEAGGIKALYRRNADCCGRKPDVAQLTTRELAYLRAMIAGGAAIWTALDQLSVRKMCSPCTRAMIALWKLRKALPGSLLHVLRRPGV